MPASPESVSRSWDPSVAARGLLTRIGRRKALLISCLEFLLRPPVFVASRLSRSSSNQAAPVGVRRILVLEYWQLGDLVLLLPFLRNLRLAYPQAHIIVAANPRCLPLLDGQGVADELFPLRVPWALSFSRWKKYNPFSAAWFRLLFALLALRRRKFDLAFSGRMDIRDNLLLWLVAARQRVGYSTGGGGFLLTDVVTPDLRRLHRSQLWLQLLRHLHHSVLENAPRLQLSATQQESASRFLAGCNIGPRDMVLGVHPGAGTPTRQWGEQNFAAVTAEVAVRSHVSVLWFLDHDGVAPPLPNFFIPVRLPLRDFTAVLARCAVLLCNDSGPMHIAAALGVPVVSVFGPMAPAWFGPLGENHRVVIREGFWCRPCFDQCIFDQPYCLRTVSLREVADALLSLLPTTAGRGRDLKVDAPPVPSPHLPVLAASERD